MPAEGGEAGDDVVADGQVADLGPGRFDDAGRLMAEHGRQRMRVETLDEVQVAVADANCCGADQDLARTRSVDVDLEHLERCADLLEHSCLHASPFAAARSPARR